MLKCIPFPHPGHCGVFLFRDATPRLADESGAKLSANSDSLHGVRVSVNSYSAQFGRNSSVLAQIVTRSGSNQLHGSL